MALVLADRVQETTLAPGTGTVSLLGPTTGFQSFGSAVGNGNTTYYCIADIGGSNWEVGVGTYTSSGTALSRDTILASSNGGSIVNFSSGTQDVFCDYPAGKTAIQNANGYVQNTIFEATNGLIVNNMTVSASYTIPSGYTASSVGPVTVSGGVTVTVPSGSRWVVL
jgi:hypothetical protein